MVVCAKSGDGEKRTVTDQFRSKGRRRRHAQRGYVRLFGCLVASLLSLNCHGDGAAKCVAGQSVACACPTAGSGVQVCNASGSFDACSCAGASAANASPASKNKCEVASLGCSDIATRGLTGWNLHKLVYEARVGGRARDAICLAQNSINSADKVLAGASYYEMSYAWDALGCRTTAVGAVEDSLRIRPSNKNGWTETCARCAELSGKCDACKTSSSQAALVPCPQDLKALAVVVTSAIMRKTPPDTKWENVTVDKCRPILLPAPGWYVIASVQQDTPDRTISVHVAVNASNAEVVAVGEAAQRSIREWCGAEINGVENHPGRASTVRTRYQCSHSTHNDEYREDYESTISPPNINIRSL